MLVDNWPIVPPMAVIASHEVAEQVSKPSTTFPYSAPKSWSVKHISPLLGYKSIFLYQAGTSLDETPWIIANPSQERGMESHP